MKIEHNNSEKRIFEMFFLSFEKTKKVTQR